MSLLNEILYICNKSDVLPYEEGSNNVAVINYIMNGTKSDILSDDDYLILDKYEYTLINPEVLKTSLDIKHLKYIAKLKSDLTVMYMVNILTDIYSPPLFLSAYDNNDLLSEDIFSVSEVKVKKTIFEKV